MGLTWCYTVDKQTRSKDALVVIYIPVLSGHKVIAKAISVRGF